MFRQRLALAALLMVGFSPSAYAHGGEVVFLAIMGVAGLAGIVLGLISAAIGFRTSRVLVFSTVLVMSIGSCLLISSTMQGLWATLKAGFGMVGMSFGFTFAVAYLAVEGIKMLSGRE